MNRLVVVTLILGLSMAPVVMASHPVAGKWEGTAETPRGAQEIAFDFMEADGHLTGTISTSRGESEVEQGTVDGNEIAFKQTLSFQGQEIVLSYHGTVDGDEIAFTREVEGQDRSSSFTAKRVK